MELDEAAREAAQKVAQVLQVSLSVTQSTLQRSERQLREERDRERQQTAVNVATQRAQEASNRSRWALAGDPNAWSNHDQNEVAAAIQSAQDAADREPAAAVALRRANHALRAAGHDGTQAADMLADQTGEHIDRQRQAQARSVTDHHAQQGRELLDEAAAAAHDEPDPIIDGDRHGALGQAAEHLAEAERQHGEAGNVYRDSPSAAARTAGEAYPTSTQHAVEAGRGGKRTTGKQRSKGTSQGRLSERGR